MKFHFENGCMWEGYPWTIAIDYECSCSGGGKPCKHCHSERDKIHTRYDGSQWIEHVWICPYVVIAKNEGDCNSTGVCLNCILDASALLANRSLGATTSSALGGERQLAH